MNEDSAVLTTQTESARRQNDTMRVEGDALGLAEELQKQKMIRARKRQAQFQQELQHSFESSLVRSFMSHNERSSRRGGQQRNADFSRLGAAGADLSMADSEPSFSGLSKQGGDSKMNLSQISTTSQARQRRPDEPPDLIFDDEDNAASKKQSIRGARNDTRRDTATVDADLEAVVHEVPISLPGVNLSLQRVRSNKYNAVQHSLKDLDSIRGSVSIKKGDLNNMSIDGLNPKISSVNGKTINKLTMRLPIYKIMQAQVLERYQRQGQSKKDEQALVALKLNKPSKNADPKSLYKITVDDKANPRAAVKYLQDPNQTVVKTLGAEPFTHKIELFDEDQVTAKDRSINEQMFDQLKLEESIWDCCQNGKNLTFFSVEDTGKKNGLSAMFNGRSRQLAPEDLQTESEKRPGMIRMTVEAIFAHIFQNKGSEFVLRLSYVEINNEMVYDLLQDGKQIFAPDEVHEENCLNIEQTMQTKARGDASRLQNLLGGDRKENDFVQESALVLKFTIENLAREKVTDYEMMLDEHDLAGIKVCKSQIVFADLPELFKKENKQMQILQLKQPLGQDPSLFAIDGFIKANVEQRRADATQKREGESELELQPIAKSAYQAGSSTDRDRGAAAELTTLAKYRLVSLLGSQLLGGNSKMVFMFSLSPEQSSANVSMLVQMATDAALVCQTSVQMNEISTEESQLIRLKDDIERKEGQVTSIEFQIKQSQEQQARGGSVNFKDRRTQPNQDGENAESQRRGSALATKTQEELDLQHKQVQKFRIINQIGTLNKQILRQEGVAKFMQQFEVNRRTRRISSILNNNEKGERMDSTNSLRRPTYVDRMSRRLASAKAFLEEDQRGVGPLNSSDIRASGRLDFNQQRTQQEIQQKIAQFVRLSVKAVNDKVNVTEFQQRVRDSVKHTIRMSVAAKKQMAQRVEENLQKLNTDLGRKVNVLSGKRDARMYEQLQARRKTNVLEDVQEKAKDEEDLVIQEGNNSLFDQNLTVQEERMEFGQKKIGGSAPVRAEGAEDEVEAGAAVDRSSSFLADHFSDINRHASQAGLDQRLLQASTDNDTLCYGDDDLLNDGDLDDFIQRNLENFQNIEVENIRLDGDVLDLDLNLKIDIPDDLDDDLALPTKSNPQVASNTGPTGQGRSTQGSSKQVRFQVNPDGSVQTTRIDKQINDLSSNLARTALQAQERVKYQDMENDLAIQGIYKSPSLYSKKQTMDNDFNDKLLLDFGTDSGFSDDDSADVLDSNEEGEAEPSFSLSVRSKPHDTTGARQSQDPAGDDSLPGEERSGTGEEENALGVREFLAMQRQNYGKNAFRGTIIDEAAEEEEEDSFEIKREIQKKKDFEKYSTQLDSIQERVNVYTTQQKKKMRQSIKQLNDLRQRASLLHQKKALERQQDSSSVRSSEKTGSSNPPPELVESAQQRLYGRKESHKIADKFLMQTAHDEDDGALDRKLGQLDCGNGLDDSSFDLTALRGTGGGALRNEFDLSLINEGDLLNEMAELERQAKNTMEELMREQEEFEQMAQRQMKKTVKKIRASIKSSIRQSRATITKKRTQRETMKRLQGASMTEDTGKAKRSGLTNEKCGNCDRYLDTIEKYEQEIDELQKEVAALRKEAGR